MKQLCLNILLTFFLSFVAGGVIHAQTPGSKKDKIDALRVAFITKKVGFTDAEARAFWPLYDEMNDKLDAVRRAFRMKYNARTNFDFVTDQEAEAYLNADLQEKQKEYEIYRDYYERFRKVLPVKKVAALRHAEDEFKKEIIRTIKEN